MDNTEIEGTIFAEASHKLDSFLEELNSPETPDYIRPNWIMKRLPYISRYDLYKWVKSGFIPDEMIQKKNKRSFFAHDGAELAGYIGFFRVEGAPLEKSVSMAQRHLKGERPF
ncbi:MAG: hypothetical protein Q8P92_05215 [Candidatus Daviesbacteria bacterium]|nr:hypothetical protein [Candidatus Daviesbacteria bacterium]